MVVVMSLWQYASSHGDVPSAITAKAAMPQKEFLNCEQLAPARDLFIWPIVTNSSIPSNPFRD